MTRCYAWPLAVLPGEDLKLHVSTPCRRFGVRLFRYGAQPAEVPGDGRTFEGAELSFGRPDEAWGWPEFQIEIGQKAPDGVYLAVPVEVAGDGTWTPADAGLELFTRPDACLFVVRRQPVPDGRRILVKLPTATYSAYNQLGGTSLYAGARWAGDWNAQGYVVSLQRPGNGGVGGEVMAGDAPDVYQRSSRRQSAAMRTRVLEFVNSGGNVCFFAGDVAEWEIDLAPAADRLFCRKMKGGPPAGNASEPKSAIWHYIDQEDWLTMSTWALGGGWWDGHRAIDGFQPAIPSHWAFDGVQFPPEGLTGGPDTPIVGYEVDGVAIARGTGTPRLSEQRRGGPGRQLLAAARLSPGWETGYALANAAMMFRTAPSGGMMFSVGTTDWSVALATDQAVGTITGNAVRRLSSRSLRIRGPVAQDGEYLEDPDAVGPGREFAWHLDGTQASALGLAGATWSVTGNAIASAAEGQEIKVSSGSGEDWLTVTATAEDTAGRSYFGSRTVQVLGQEEYLRRRIVATMHAMAYPDEQGGSLVDQRTSEASLAGRVIPIRLRWVRSQTRVLAELTAELEALWESSGRITDGDLEPG